MVTVRKNALHNNTNGAHCVRIRFEGNVLSIPFEALHVGLYSPPYDIIAGIAGYFDMRFSDFKDYVITRLANGNIIMERASA